MPGVPRVRDLIEVVAPNDVALRVLDGAMVIRSSGSHDKQ